MIGLPCLIRVPGAHCRPVAGGVRPGSPVSHGTGAEAWIAGEASDRSAETGLPAEAVVPIGTIAWCPDEAALLPASGAVVIGSGGVRSPVRGPVAVMALATSGSGACAPGFGGMVQALAAGLASIVAPAARGRSAMFGCPVSGVPAGRGTGGRAGGRKKSLREMVVLLVTLAASPLSARLVAGRSGAWPSSKFGVAGFPG